MQFDINTFTFPSLYLCFKSFQTVLSYPKHHLHRLPYSGFMNESNCQKQKMFFQSVFCKLPHSVCEQAERNKIVTLCTPWVHTACSDHCATLWGSSTKRFLNILNHQCSFCCEKRSQTMLSNTVIKHVARQFRNGKLCSCIFSFLQYLKIHFEKEW